MWGWLWLKQVSLLKKEKKNILGDSVETRCKIGRIDKVLSWQKHHEGGHTSNHTSLMQQKKWCHSPGVSGVMFWFSLPVLPSFGPPSLESPGQETGGSIWTNWSQSLLKRPPLFPSRASQGVTGCASSRARASPCISVSTPHFQQNLHSSHTFHCFLHHLFVLVVFLLDYLADELFIHSHSLTWFSSCWRSSLRLDRPLSHCAIRKN